MWGHAERLRGTTLYPSNGTALSRVLDELSLRVVPDALWEIAKPLMQRFDARPQEVAVHRWEDRAVFTAIVYVLTSDVHGGIGRPRSGHRSYAAPKVYRVGQHMEADMGPAPGRRIDHSLTRTAASGA